jgi:D-3-phosphoglycerate dehydrogenase / 2-oxoglutarate reductase
MKALITTIPFGEMDKTPIDLLNEHKIEYTINPFNKKITEEELYSIIGEFDLLIAGTELITKKVLDNAKKLKLISRVGVGLDGVNLNYARKKNIQVTYTPDAPVNAVAELTVGLMIDLLRNIHIANLNMHDGKWKRLFGRRLGEVTLGIIGVGRIGSTVLEIISAFSDKSILVNDINPNYKLNKKFNIKWVTKEDILSKSDLISIHVPLTKLTKNMIGKKELGFLNSNALLVNTSRGGIINEKDLAQVLINENIGGAAIDVFENEPYYGGLNKLNNCILTSHMGSMAVDCRTRMEIEATKEIVLFVNGKPQISHVPESEYILQSAVKTELIS